MMGNIVLILIILSAVSGALVYIFREKKKGKCIGCPYAKQCHKKIKN